MKDNHEYQDIFNPRHIYIAKVKDPLIPNGCDKDNLSLLNFLEENSLDKKDIPHFHLSFIYRQAWKERVDHLVKHLNRMPEFGEKYIPALDITMVFEENLAVDCDTWVKDKLHRLNRAFNIAPDGMNNIISLNVYEIEGTPYSRIIRAIVVPIGKDGNFVTVDKDYVLEKRSRLNESYIRYNDETQYITFYVDDVVNGVKNYAI